MKRGSTLFLKMILSLIALLTLLCMLWFPQTEGRALNLDLFHIYSDPFILYIYIASTPFFVGIYQAIKLLNFIDKHKAFSQGAVNTLKNIKYASILLIGLIALALVYIHLFAGGDDPAGPTMLGACVSLALGVVATAAGVFQKLLQNAVDIKQENDLTV